MRNLISIIVVIALSLPSCELYAAGKRKQRQARRSENVSQPAAYGMKCGKALALISLVTIGAAVAYHNWGPAGHVQIGQPPAAAESTPQEKQDELASFLKSHNLTIPAGGLKITHLGQVHARGSELQSDPNTKPFSWIVLSQYRALGELRKPENKAKQILFEGVTETLNPLDREKWRMLYEQVKDAPNFFQKVNEIDNGLIQMYFVSRHLLKNGVPQRPLTEWSKEEKSALLLGAPFILWAAGELDTIYPAENDETNRLAGQALKADDAVAFEKANQKREVGALANIIEQANKTGGRDFILVFGDFHDFTDYASPQLDIGFKETLTEEEEQQMTDWQTNHPR